MKGTVLLVGGRSKAKALAQSLLKKGYRVTVINKDLSDCEKLAENEKLTVIHGDGTKPYVLEDAGAVAKSWPTFFEDMARGLGTRWQAREE